MDACKELSLSNLVGGGYKSFWDCKKRYRIVKGSRGSKKSKTTALNLIFRMMQHPEANTLVIRQTFATLRDSCFSDLLWAISRFQVDHLWKSTTNPLEITYLPTGQKILFRGNDEPLKITSIAVPKGVLCWVWFEEFFEINKEDDFNKIDLSIRGEVPSGLFKQITMTMNPWSALHFSKARFFDSSDDDIFAITTTYQCNEWLDDADRRIFEKMRNNNPRRYRIEGLGEWGIADGLIYENVEMAHFDINVLRTQKDMKAAYGLDFGFTDPTAFVACMIDDNASKIYVFDEFYKIGLTNQMIAKEIQARGYGGERIICDAAEPKSIEELHEEGIRAIPSRKGRDSVLHGIQKIQNYKLIVHPQCVEFWREISNYCWAKDRFGKPMDKPEHEFSHCMDALRYAISIHAMGDSFSFN